jgi:hypothetical protein
MLKTKFSRESWTSLQLLGIIKISEECPKGTVLTELSFEAMISFRASK